LGFAEFAWGVNKRRGSLLLPGQKGLSFIYALENQGFGLSVSCFPGRGTRRRNGAVFARRFVTGRHEVIRRVATRALRQMADGERFGDDGAAQNLSATLFPFKTGFLYPCSKLQRRAGGFLSGGGEPFTARRNLR
jgi:hypothetical protein